MNKARLLKRVFDIDTDHCPNCGGSELKIIAVILEPPVIEKSLSHLWPNPQRPPKGRARSRVCPWCRDGCILKRTLINEQRGGTNWRSLFGPIWPGQAPTP